MFQVAQSFSVWCTITNGHFRSKRPQNRPWGSRQRWLPVRRPSLPDLQSGGHTRDICSGRWMRGQPHDIKQPQCKWQAVPEWKLQGLAPWRLSALCCYLLCFHLQVCVLNPNHTIGLTLSGTDYQRVHCGTGCVEHLDKRTVRWWMKDRESLHGVMKNILYVNNCYYYFF